MKMIDEKGRIFGRINLLDLAVLLIMAAAIAFLCYYLFFTDKETYDLDVFYTIEVRGTDPSLRDAISVGDEIFDAVFGVYLGEVYEVEWEYTILTVLDKKTNENIEVSSPNLITLFVKIKGDGNETDRTIECEGIEIRLGKETNFKGKGYAQTGYVVDLSYQPKSSETGEVE